MGLKVLREGGVVRLLDSVASQHFDSNEHNFIAMHKCSPFPIEVATRHIVYVTKRGTVHFACDQGGKTKVFTLSDVYYCQGDAKMRPTQQ